LCCLTIFERANEADQSPALLYSVETLLQCLTTDAIDNGIEVSVAPSDRTRSLFAAEQVADIFNFAQLPIWTSMTPTPPVRNQPTILIV
jgi:hypothetical protein